jgi:hypothetical protein
MAASSARQSEHHAAPYSPAGPYFTAPPSRRNADWSLVSPHRWHDDETGTSSTSGRTSRRGADGSARRAFSAHSWATGGCSSIVEPQPSKLVVGFDSPHPLCWSEGVSAGRSGFRPLNDLLDATRHFRPFPGRARDGCGTGTLPITRHAGLGPAAFAAPERGETREAFEVVEAHHPSRRCIQRRGTPPPSHAHSLWETATGSPAPRPDAAGTATSPSRQQAGVPR